jgi:SAM-dependent methyltransferase
MNFWDQQFSTPDFKYGKAANCFLRDQAFRLSPNSKVLLPGDGEGRNSVWLATQGHQVTAVDNSAVGLAKAQRLAAEHLVAVETVLADLEHWVPTPASFDALVLTYVHLPASLRPLAHRHLAEALRPGGWFILEAFHPRQLAYTSGGPKAEAMLYTTDLIRRDLDALAVPGFTEVLAWEGEVQLDEGNGHQGPAYLTRYIAQRK